MFGLSVEHLLVIGIIVLLFGARKLPALGQALGQSVRNFKGSFEAEGESEKLSPPEVKTSSVSNAEKFTSSRTE